MVSSLLDIYHGLHVNCKQRLGKSPSVDCMISLHSVSTMGKKSKLPPSTIAKIRITPKLSLGSFYSADYALWFKLPLNTICLFHFSLHIGEVLS